MTASDTNVEQNEAKPNQASILFINACVRGECSRTLQLCREYLSGKENITEINLAELSLPHFDGELVAKRVSLQETQQWDDPIFDLSRQFAQADEIVIGAPYWDLSFPAALKTYIEHVSVCDITFHYTEEGNYEGLSRAKYITYIATSGGFVPEEENFGYQYICGMAKMFGVPEVRYVVAEGLDIQGMDIDAQMDKARAKLAFL